MQRLAPVVAVLAVLSAGAASSRDRGATKTVLVFLDDLHIEFVNTGRLRTALATFAERLPSTERAAGMVSDASSRIVIQPTRENADFLVVARKATGAGLKPDDRLNPTPAIESEMVRRMLVARSTLQNAIDTMHPDAVLYITEGDAQQPTAGMTLPIAVTQPDRIDAALTDLLSR